MKAAQAGSTEHAGVQLLRELVAIDSVNPALVEGGAGEAAIAAFVAGWLERAGLEVRLEEAAPGRPNVIARATGRADGRTLLLNGHLDTVGYAGMSEPLEPRLEDGRLYGRGAQDMKSGLAAIMLAGAHAARTRPSGDVVVACVVDEELASIGSEALAASLRADAVVVAEPTELDVCVAHKGFVWLEAETEGRAAHGSRFDLGRDAIVAMAPVLAGVADLDRALRGRPPHPLLGPASVHASVIEGGREWSTYPESCRLALERRTLPGESVADVEAELRRLLPEHGRLRVALARPPLETPADEPIVRHLLEAAHRRPVDARTVGLPFWTDAALFSAAGVPSVVFGPGGGGLHETCEWADLEQLERAVSILDAVVDGFCG